MTDTTSTRPHLGEELREILAHELARRYGDDSPSVKYLREGIDKFVMPEGSQDLIAAALAAMSRVRAPLPQPTAQSTGEVDACRDCGRTRKAHETLGWECNRFQPRASTPAQSVLVAEVLAICADHKARADVPKRDDWQLGYAAACREIAVDVRRLAAPCQPAPVVDTGPKWQSYDHEDKSTWPTQVGVYRVMVSGDSESLDGHTIYEYPDYPTWAEAFEDEDDDGEEIVMFGQGTHDEEADTFFAYCGPVSIPVFSEKALTPPQSTEEKS